MSALVFRLQSGLRREWRSSVSLALFVAVAVGTVLALAAGAQRTSSAPDRYTSTYAGNFDASIVQFAGSPATDDVAAMPAVRSVHSITFFFGALVALDSSTDVDPNDLDAGATLAGSYLATGMRLLEGRDTDPTKEGEFIADKDFIDASKAHIGDRFRVITLTAEQASAAGGDTPPDQWGGPTFEATLVGIVDGPSSLDDPDPGLLFSPAVLQHEDLGTRLTIMAVGLKPGFELDDLREQLDASPIGESVSVDSADVVSRAVREAVHAQGQGMWLITLAAAVAAVAALGQIVGRQTRVTPADRTKLASIGVTAGQIDAESLTRAAVPTLVGTLLAIVLSTVPSGLFPLGFVHRVEPHPGWSADLRILLLGSVILFVALVAWMFVAIILTRPRRARPGASSTIDGLASSVPFATLSTGLLFAFRRRSQDSSSFRGAVLGLMVAIAGVAGATTFAIGLNRLVDDPARFGNNFDMGFGSGEDALPESFLTTLANDPDVVAATGYATAQVRAGASTIQLVGIQSLKGGARPAVRSGRLPESADEIALGALSAHDLGVEVGDDLVLSNGGEPRSFRVTGLAVVPSLEEGAGVGQEAVVTIEGLRALDPSAQINGASAVLRTGASLMETSLRLQQQTGVRGGPAATPASITNISRISGIPVLLAMLLGVLALVSSTQAIVVSVRNRRRDVAVLRSLGGDRRFITTAIHWQATLLAVPPLLVGSVVGVVAGRTIFRLFVDRIGALDQPHVPWLLLGATVVGFVLVANAAAWLGARRSLSVGTASLLRAE
jgi:putative ABC transport system permease protein